MDYYENIVIDYLRADRALFVNTQCCLQLVKAHNPDTSGRHWYCDAVAADFRSHTVFLCEISYGSQLSALCKRLKDWQDHWKSLVDALKRDCYLPLEWPVHVWLFVPKHVVSLLEKRLSRIGNGLPLNFIHKITELENVQPWLYCSWDRTAEADKGGIL
jgi:hypothetical protein